MSNSISQASPPTNENSTASETRSSGDINGNAIGNAGDDQIPKFVVACTNSSEASQLLDKKVILWGGRTLVLCFDGTADKYGNENTNVIKLFSALKKNDKRKQLVYYQAGVGTYGHKHHFFPELAALSDFAFAWSIGMHIQAGYKFLMDNYQDGDRICLFGFSRGAYTARALAGMIHKVGLLSKDNHDQINFAYKLYRDTSPSSSVLSAGFKQTFSIPNIRIHFIGVFDTVSSVGLFGEKFPFDSEGDKDVVHFRHAMALDERRAKFKNKLWEKVEKEVLGLTGHGEKKKKLEEKEEREKQMVERTIGGDNVEYYEGNGVYTKDPSLVANAETGDSQESSNFLDKKLPSMGQGFLGSFVNGKDMDKEKAKDKKKKKMTVDEVEEWMSGSTTKKSDIKEVWFLGGHCDVGGGGCPNTQTQTLANIPLRWMIRECFKCETGIIFSSSTLQSLGLNISTLYPVVKPRPDMGNLEGEEKLDFLDSRQPLLDELMKAIGWWLLEFFPMKQYYIHENAWRTSFEPNLGRHRVILDQSSDFHRSVKIRMKEMGYQIKALMNRGEELTFVE